MTFFDASPSPYSAFDKFTYILNGKPRRKSKNMSGKYYYIINLEANLNLNAKKIRNRLSKLNL